MSGPLLWPRALPCPNLQAMTFIPDGGVIGSEFESGVSRDRRLYDHLPTLYEATITCDRLETLLFMSFFDKTAGGEFEIILGSPFSLEDVVTRHRAKFVGNPRYDEATALRRSIQFQLRLEAVDIPDFDELAYLAAYGSDARDIFNRFDHLMNVEMPDHMGDA